MKYQKKIISALKNIKNQSYFVHKMNRLLVAIVSWFNFKLIWLHRFLVTETIKRKIKLTQTGEVKNQGTSSPGRFSTLHNIPINYKLNFHYLQVFLSLLQKTNDKISVQNIFHYLYTSSSRFETGVLGKKGFFYIIKPWRRYTEVCPLVSQKRTFERQNDNIFYFICLVIVNIDNKTKD